MNDADKRIPYRNMILRCGIAGFSDVELLAMYDLIIKFIVLILFSSHLIKGELENNDEGFD